jgi:hypothetical protein
MRAADAPPVAAEPTLPSFRIRHLLILGLVGLLGWTAVPKLRAAWALHSAAATFANYALCMVGPTGPSLLRDNPRAFWRMVRRRLVTSAPSERPFAECAQHVGELTGSLEIERAHVAHASDFVEYGGEAADRAAAGARGELTVASLLVTTRPLARLAEEAQPFVRGGYTQLVQPASHAKEAVHPVALPRPLVGRGLPAWGALYEASHVDGQTAVVTMGRGANRSVYRSGDGGATWQVASLRDPAVRHLAGRCAAGDTGASFRFGISEDRRYKIVRSLMPDGSEARARLVDRGTRVFAASCDEGAMAVLAGEEGSREVSLLICRFQGQCLGAELPTLGSIAPRYPMDVARVRGTTVVSTTMHGIVRVTSSRDDGQSWAPWTVAYDPAAHDDLPVSAVPPSHLLVLGERLALYGGADAPDVAYPTLFSTNLGASWKGM